LLASCGLLQRKAPQPTVTRTELVYVPVPAYKLLPSELTAPIPDPPAPLFTCDDGKGAPRLCVLDALAQIPAYQGALQLCNSDRARAALLGTTDGQ
jgi:hypothetical protein